MNDQYLVTQEMKSGMKLSSKLGFYAQDAVFLICWLGIVYGLQSLVSSKFKPIYWIISVTVGLIMTLPSKWNPKRRNYATLLFYVEKDDFIYYPCYMKNRIKGKKNMSKKKKEVRTTDELIPIVRYDTDYDCFECKKGYMNILQIITKDIVNASIDEIDYDIAKLTKYNKLEYEDYKIISMNFPCSTSEQQKYLKGKIERTSNSKHLKYLNSSLAELEWVQEKKSKREFYLMIFSDSTDGIKKMEADMKSALQSRDKMIEDMTPDKKETILYRICNPASILTGGTK